MACPKIRNQEEASQYFGKRLILYVKTMRDNTGEPYVASVSGEISVASERGITLCWGELFLNYEHIKRVVVRD